jgi:hypothetical protein
MSELRERPGDQPLPVPNGLPDVQSMVVADIEARKQLGIKRYGTPLQPHNGRDALRDAYDEALDLATYLRQVIAERDGEPVSKGVRYWVQVNDEFMASEPDWPVELRVVERGGSVCPGVRWWLFEDEGAPAEIEGREVELTFSRPTSGRAQVIERRVTGG